MTEKNHHRPYPIRIGMTLALVREANSENCLDLIFAVLPCEKAIIVPDTNYVISAIRKFMLYMPIPGSFENKGLQI